MSHGPAPRPSHAQGWITDPPIADWDDAYANAAHIPQSERWPDRWIEAARRHRERVAARAGVSDGESTDGEGSDAEFDIAYGTHERERLDLYRPPRDATRVTDGASPRGLVLFVHGGYWMKFDRSVFSHCAAGPLARGWAVATPSYPLAPDWTLDRIAGALARSLRVASERVAGPIRLVGHSAGGHLVTRILSSHDGTAPPIGRELGRRVERVVSISGVHDLRPLLRTGINATLRLDPATARSESPALLAPFEGTSLVAWVGQAERAEFVRQSRLLADTWRGLGAATRLVVEPDRHHFDVIEALADPASPLTDCVAS